MEKDRVNQKFRLIIVGGSAGSLKVVFRLLEETSASFPIPIVLVLHRDPTGNSLLVELLNSKTRLQVREIEEKDTIQPGFIYICPADYHVLIENDHSFSLDYSEKINFSRPSIDVVFRSAADVFTDAVLAILLSGGNADGTDGLGQIRERGGVAIVQDPAEAEVGYMPEQAILKENADYVLTTDEIVTMLKALKM